MNTQSVGDGSIVEALAAQVSYPFATFIPTFSSSGGASCACGGRHDLSRQICRSGGAAFGTVATSAGPADVAASRPLDPALLSVLAANPTSAQREFVGISGVAALAVPLRHEPGDGGVSALGFDAGDAELHGDRLLALRGLAARAILGHDLSVRKCPAMAAIKYKVELTEAERSRLNDAQSLVPGSPADGCWSCPGSS